MSKRVSKAASLELTFLAALESIHADVDTSEIAEIQDWSGAVRGKLYAASIKGASQIPNPKAGLPPALSGSIAADVPAPSSKGISGVVFDDSGNVTSCGSVQYSQMAIPQLVAVGISESSEEAWSEFIRRYHRLIKAVITKAVRRFGNVSHDLVDDLTQNVYLKLCADNFRALRNVEILQENAFLGFLKVVATHTVQDYFRHTAASKTGGTYELEAVEAAIPGDQGLRRDASSELERAILLERIDTILKTFLHEPNFARDRAIFWLYYRQGLPTKEIAALSDIKLSVKGVESVLLRLTRQLKVALR
ncbi:MAG TPA: sigma-70 family RNA polymerase sigma factor [Candidatus Angelobacter sp.]|nr:sigma-70 family RNA polymerase sigma factor [Candidatus Angelobacter sp.]